MAEDAYRSGHGGILDLLDMLRTITETRLTALEHAERALLAEVALLNATGRVDGPPRGRSSGVRRPLRP